MDISEAIAGLKREPGFSDQVGMVLVHNGVVRGRSLNGGRVEALEVRPDQAGIQAIAREMSGRPGIFRVLAEARAGVFAPGEDLLFIVVAGDVRENVKAVLAEALERIKTQAVAKREILAE
ncbi:MAG: molybdenum cofactor biosynthesis protein MoaE [Desulfovibrionaceae bacterium]|nr:molybdenum cofactor biosynthesis protein MoaE [Desulfovibrionaceae bacterium]MDD4952250.1 molybdenum cofactor biosynthesis protein MoaE [Desulfovibrionaceae bacterium]